MGKGKCDSKPSPTIALFSDVSRYIGGNRTAIDRPCFVPSSLRGYAMFSQSDLVKQPATRKIASRHPTLIVLACWLVMLDSFFLSALQVK